MPKVGLPLSLTQQNPLCWFTAFANPTKPKANTLCNLNLTKKNVPVHLPSILLVLLPSRPPKSCLSQPLRPTPHVSRMRTVPWGLHKQLHVLQPQGNFPPNTTAATAFTKSTFVPRSVHF